MRSIVVSTCLVASLIATTSTFAQEWARFRGPNGTGFSRAQTIPTTWTEKDYNWQAKLPGTGHSSPVVWGDRIFVTTTDVKDAGNSLRCHSAKDGSLLWSVSVDFAPFRKHKLNLAWWISRRDDGVHQASPQAGHTQLPSRQ